MRRPASRVVVSVLALFLGACASRPLPKYEKPIARVRVQQVRTTAYTHSEADHIQHGRSTALGTTLCATNVKSAAADWSRWPAGSLFRIVETGELYRVDDYGWALSGTNTIDLYKPTRSAMNKWGVRRVTIENLAWGDVDKSLAILKSRSKYKHVRRMINQIEDRYAELKRPVESLAPAVAQAAPMAPPVATPVALAVTRVAVPARPALAVVAAAPARAPLPSSRPVGAPPLTPFRSAQ